MLTSKRATAAAAALHVRVVDGEAGAHEAVDVVELRAHDVGDAHGVDEHPDALGLEDLVVVGDLIVEVDAVLETGAAAWPDSDTQREILFAFLGHEGLDLLGSVISDVDDGCLFLLLHQHLQCCSRLLGREIITPSTVYFNAAFGRSSGAFHAAPCRDGLCGRTSSSSTVRIARMGSRPRAPFASVAGPRRPQARYGRRRLLDPRRCQANRGGPSRQRRTAPWGPPPHQRPRRGAVLARWGSARASRRG